MGTLEFTLSTPIRITIKKDGQADLQDVETLELFSPPAKEKRLPIRLRKGFMKAAMGFADPDRNDKTGADDNDGAEENVLKGSDIESMLFASDIDIEQYMRDFRDLILIKGVCTAREMPFLDNHWDGMTAEDAMRLMGEYIAHFFAPSWLPKETTKT